VPALHGIIGALFRILCLELYPYWQLEGLQASRRRTAIITGVVMFIPA
jgi:hypothetical protein